MDQGEIELSHPSPATDPAHVADVAQTRVGKAQRDVVALGLAAAAIIMFVGTGGSVLPQVVRAWTQGGQGPDGMLVNALLLNIALIIFGWRRYNDLTREVDERREAEKRACLLALTDPLTGCFNRRSIGPKTDELLAVAKSRGQAVAFLLFDLDNFKAINDLNGHVAGDALLNAAALRVSRLLPPENVLARLGGDEFAAVITFDPANPATIDRLADRLLETVAMPFQHEGLSLETTISIGIASSDKTRSGDGRIDAQALLHNADIAMYHAKKQGRNCHYWFEPEMANELRFRSELETGIRRGLTRGEFVPYYEQQIDLETGELVGFEMLARWRSPALGLVSPEIFIPIAEEIGAIAEMSEQLIAQALRDASTWDPSLTISVNISAIQLRDPWFAQRILKLLVEANFPASRLEIEITESCLHENVGVVRSLVTSLKNQGVAISLDDFGTGYSSLAQLRSLPFDRIKIDRSFVSSINASKDASTIVKSITSLGEGMNLPITAEGIESPEVLAELRTMGKYKGQGYLYGRPVDATTVAQMLAEKGLLVTERTTQLDLKPDGPIDAPAWSGTHG
ncbi:bifunctional diguanylate cyclase/phosphodiesterase [Novosphingobium sp. Gsoil 351]|uniref:putative bifunctional diguanylate cyclase/phosphodiesterase n=1 Tax=Novosphingobium sp. Gsoil 351 TaxID=2675225 RepID=UPI0012B47A5F|nr:EAL domain-containing protein [Novosphingobium sp. Gsoil 351]QGN56051.1 EAL domain-containing protein [Novosphingobium sp. Gsoil 351]